MKEYEELEAKKRLFAIEKLEFEAYKDQEMKKL